MTRPTLVMIPGTLCDERVFRRQKRALRGLAEVVVLDYRKLDRLDAWAPQVLRSLPPRFSVAGFSLGGLWALELLRLAPERIERLAMIASNAQAANAPGKRKSEHLRHLWCERGPSAVARQVKPAYFHHERCRRQHASLVHDMAIKTSRKAAFAEFAWAATRPDGRAALSSFGGGLLLVSGAKDRLCPPLWQRAMLAAQPRATWLELPRVGHFIPLEAGGRLNQALIGWMRS